MKASSEDGKENAATKTTSSGKDVADAKLVVKPAETAAKTDVKSSEENKDGKKTTDSEKVVKDSIPAP